MGVADTMRFDDPTLELLDTLFEVPRETRFQKTNRICKRAVEIAEGVTAKSSVELWFDLSSTSAT